MPEVIMLVGLPGCGKSTWVGKFLETQEPNSYRIISSDALIEETARECGVTYDVAHDLIPQETISAMLYEQVHQCVITNQNLIWDQTNLTEERRRDKLRMIPLTWTRRCVVFEVPVDEIKRRRDAREAANPGKTLPSDIIESMTAAYQPPSRLEGWDEITFVRA